MYTGNVITVIQSDGGKIAPGSVGVDSGGTKTFTITPSPNYAIVDVLVDGESVGTQTSYEFTNITNDHTITARFALIPYTITTITDEYAEINGVYTNHICTVCGGRDHECDVVNIFIEANNAEITEE